ncbi:1-aminocyclopropane-1-carboxylate synthase 6 isoform X2 [Cryptomeria japonica]|uniref:1-aminocyclopropane-1-carboxylate synthase 6 isoform X2 n=1 Tax=Cryptomeria japonica TaxID=3369 RepID=UPI0027DA21C0|nr:1-aminocyclopropane-1-carboxylate synthase 6 isoform X2 [Cryptomeria japonica]
MTPNNNNSSSSSRGIEERRKERGPGAMRIIVPLQGVVQGRGGLVLGSVIPCALFYFLQLYLRKNRSPPPTAAPPESQSQSQSSHSLTPRRSMRSPTRPPFVSSRANHATDREVSLHYLGLKACKENPFDAHSNPSGIIQMGLADNQAMAGLMGDVLKAAFNPSQIVLTAGASAALEILGFCLAEPGNAFLVPSPYYPGFDRDFNLRTGVELVPVPCRSTDNFDATINALERAFNQTKKRGVAVRALLISNPSNPVGKTLDSEMLTMLLEFAREKNIHLICDEIYAGSVYDSPEFISIAKFLESGEFDKRRVHIIYGTSKDLGLAGFRVGALYSYNDTVVNAAQKFARFCSVSSHTQCLLISILSDSQFIKKYLRENQRRLRERSAAFSEGLTKAGIRCFKSNGGLYLWVEMADLMPSFNQKGEHALWERLLSEAKINITPGSACHCIQPGWFRVCFATLSDHDASVALQRIQEFSKRCKT